MIADKNLELKEKFLAYYRELPVIKLAAGWIGRTDDTITNWRKDDTDFSEQIDNAKSDWAKKTSKQVKSKEWLLERVMKDHFAPRQEITGADGEPLVVIKSNDNPSQSVAN